MPKKQQPKAPDAPKLTPFQAWAATPEAALDELCDHIASGGHMAGFCQPRGFSYATMLRWLEASPERAKFYARAREDRADMLADEIVSISDEAETKLKADGEDVALVLDATAVQRNKLRVDARKWTASKLKPRSYGDKMALTDGDGQPLAAPAPVFNVTVKGR